MKDLQLRIRFNCYSKESYEEVESLLENPETKNYIDSLDNDGYNNLLNQLVEEEKGYVSSSDRGKVK